MPMGRAGVGTFVKNMGSEKTPPLHELVEVRSSETHTVPVLCHSLSRAEATVARSAPPWGVPRYNQGQMKRRVPPPSKRAELRATLTAIATRRPPGEPAVRLGVSLE